MKDQPSESKELCIRTASGSSEVTLSVCDAGPPAGETMFERMFEAFYTTKADGLGMGLSISKSIVNAHQGRIWASRNSDRGVTMHLALPRK